MAKHNQNGQPDQSGGVLVTIILAVLLAGAIGFGAWAFASRQSYKNDTDAKINVAVQAAVKKEDASNDAIFAAKSENPLTTYNGPQAYGSLAVEYPKTWSGYIDSTNSGTPVNAYFAPGIVPSASDPASIFALRIEVLNEAYSQVVQTFSGNQKNGLVTVSAYSLPKVPSVVGVEATGQIQGQTNGTMVVLPLRANTLEIWTQGSQYLNDFNSNILPNLSFSP